jgi:dienelactone hydrolase
MNRREFLARTSSASIGFSFMTKLVPSRMAAEESTLAAGEQSTSTAATEGATLAGTAPLTVDGDLAAQMVEEIQHFLLHKTDQAATDRKSLWKHDYRSVAEYNLSIASTRDRFREIIGAMDPRVEPSSPQILQTISTPAPISQTKNYKIYPIRWPVFDAVVEGFAGLAVEGLLLEPNQPPVARVIAVPDADWSPEMLVGLAPGVPPAAQFARRLVENGCQVIVPLVINRADTFSGIPGIQMTNEPHREWIYRMAYEAGHHLIGFEVQAILAAVDWFASENKSRSLPVGIIGYGEGGLLALYSAAIDQRIDVSLVSGYFQPRENLWQEPIYRDIWGLVQEFGDAELASLIAPRTLIIEASQGPQVDGPPPVTEVHKQAACPNGKLIGPALDRVKEEFTRARTFFAALKAENKLALVISGEGKGLPGSDAALRSFLRSMGVKAGLGAEAGLPVDNRQNYDPMPRLHRQFDQMVGFTQALIQKSPTRRKEFWANADASSIKTWKATTQFYREFVWDHVIGRMPSPNLPPQARTRLILEEPRYRGYEVLLDVWPDVSAYGILLVPKDIKSGERRPVVVCQHGLEGRPSDVADPRIDSHFYHHFAARLADQGFVTYAPQNPYIGEDNFRIIQRMGHPLKLSLFSFIIGQHEQTLTWLAEQSFVDPERIGFYGLSYGGKTAVRVPPFLDRYALSICAGDFNEWVWKTTNVETSYSYLLTKEYDMYEFNFANVVNYADLANLMAPRPFMVERGHDDPVGMDEWIAYEYARVRQFYDKMGIGDKTEIEFFNGPHTIHGVGTFEFLRRHLKWPVSS